MDEMERRMPREPAILWHLIMGLILELNYISGLFHAVAREAWRMRCVTVVEGQNEKRE